VTGPSLDGRVVAVTGTSRGIGVGIASRMIAAGARVVGTSRSDSTAELVRSNRFVHVQSDIATASPDLLVTTALERFGRLDALVNNAGVEYVGDCWATSDEDLAAMLAINLTAPFAISQACARHWVQAGTAGVVVNVCSVESQVAWPDPPQSAYAVSKGGLLGLTRAMALDLAPHGIRVVAIGPGAIDTGMAPADAAYTRRIPLGNAAGTPEDVGDAAVFLVSRAARYITGEIVYVDGGYLVP
jgi:glucose 1-dehydrogenase